MKRGVSLVEMLLVLALTGILFASVAGVVGWSGRLVRAQRSDMETGEALLTVRAVMDGELRWLDAATDLHPVGTDAVELRAIRGVGIVCSALNRTLYVRYRGLRSPTGQKDSVLALDGPSTAAVLDARRAEDACPKAPGEAVYALRLDHSLTTGGILLFERGSYHLANDALRYRIGNAGRQPLTASLFRHPSFEVAGPGVRAVTAVLATPGSGPSRSLPRLTVYMANAALPTAAAPEQQ